MIENPDKAKQLIALAIQDFETIYDHFDAMLKAGKQLSVSWMGIPSFGETIYDHFDAMLKAGKQLSVSWMGIPSFGRMHIPSCDFSALISPTMFEEFCLPVLRREVQTMTHNIFHVDGRGVARHIDMILDVPEVHAIQWVQGVGDDYPIMQWVPPIMQWVPFIKRVQTRAPIIVDLDKRDLDDFMDAVEPEGIFLWVATESEAEERDILRKVTRWAGCKRF